MATATELRSLINSLSDEAAAEFAALWAQFPGMSVDDIYDALMDITPALVGDYADAATTISAEWYDEHRSSLGIGGTFIADIPPTQALGAEALAGWGSSLTRQQPVDWDAALVRITGGLQRRVADASRDTIAFNTDRDSRSVGWQRQARSTGCGFCQMLAGRGTVFRSRTTADFGAHDHCQCLVLPAFGGEPSPVRAYTPTSATITAADRARTRAWIKANL